MGKILNKGGKVIKGVNICLELNKGYNTIRDKTLSKKEKAFEIIKQVVDNGISSGIVIACSAVGGIPRKHSWHIIV